ncbi:CYFA0S01e15478g1_1 [Cyberlindnera fabianii]|uniref:CYFA0S01e15478g1_1 n=1 Tax=Cyberlindnera fabianii TaxID=36022 RepID=A0A061AJH2_CYBFA|nr:CYFA0S01e15478g1_1 [Cyberlindnera fabianii]
MEQINLSTHGKEIQRAYDQVVRGEGDFTWVIYGPDSSKAYKVAESGTDFDEFLAGFDDAAIQFGLARINPPGSDVFKNLLVGWCPDSAPLKSRSSFAQNFAEVSKLLKGYHVQVTARDSDDLDKKELLSRLSAAAGARYSIQAARSNAPPNAASTRPTPSPKPFAPKPAAASPKPTPSPAKKFEPPIIKPAATNKVAVDEDEWNEPEVEERDFTKNPLKPNVSSWKPIGRVNLEEHIKEEKARPDPRLELEQLKKQDKAKRDQEIDDYLKAKSATSGSKAPAPATGITKTQPLGGISKNFGSNNGKTPAQLWAEKKAKAAGSSPAPAAAAPISSEKIEPEEEADVSDLKSKFEKLSAQEAQPEPEVDEEEEEEDEQETPEPAVEEVKPVLPSRGAVPPPPPSRTPEPSAPSLPSRASAQPESEPEEEEEEEPEPEAEVAESEEEAEEAGALAIAEYDYDAAEDNELTFVEGAKIINIQFIDEDWWLGELESGEKGLFPSNYVSLQ